MLEKIADFFDVSTDYLLGREEKGKGLGGVNTLDVTGLSPLQIKHIQLIVEDIRERNYEYLFKKELPHLCSSSVVISAVIPLTLIYQAFPARIFLFRQCLKYQPAHNRPTVQEPDGFLTIVSGPSMDRLHGSG